MNLLRCIITLILISACAIHAQIHEKRAYDGRHRPLFSDFYTGSPLTEFRADVLDTNSLALATDTLIIDFESRQVTFARVDTATGTILWQFHYDELADYLRDMENYTRSALWDAIALEKGKITRKSFTKGAQQGLTFALPAHLPRWATRILGQEPPKLSITGNQKILIGATRQISGAGDTREAAIITPNFQPTSNFNIKGSVGRLLRLEINLKGNVTDDDFFAQAKDQLSQIKIHYREDTPGELEDDIIQEVEIGKTNFQMPGQGLAGYSSGSNEGLFGIKIRSKFGPLDLTTIASIENVETQRKTINNNTQATDSSLTEARYVKNQFFFIDDVYRQKYQDYTKEVPGILTENIILYLKTNTVNPNDADRIHYAFYPESGILNQAFPFKRLILNEDYEIDQSRPGVIKFNTRLSDADVVGMYVDLPGLVKGDTTTEEIKIATGNDTTTVNAYTNLWILKNSNMTITDSTYNLMLRNVYYVGSSDETSFSLKVRRKNADGSTQEQNDDGRLFTDILNLSEAGTILRNNSEIFDLNDGHMYIPPFIAQEGGNPLWPFTNSELGSNGGQTNVNPSIYDDSKNEINEYFQIVTTSKKRSERFTLDYGLVEGSERLWTSSGDTLVRYVDYDIDYGFGQVTLLSSKAQSADIIEADYQKESLFLLDKKVFVGINGKLDLPGIGRNSFLSTTVMWQLMDAKNMIPKVGTEPYNRFLFDTNLRLDFAPRWMTSAVNLLPLVSREAPSSAQFDIEIAHSTTKNSAKSNGEATIDNFSTSARTYALGISHFNWHQAAPDADWVTDFRSHPPAWDFYWYQPTIGDNRAYRREIYPLEQGAGAETYNDRMSTLKLVAQPFPEDSELRDGISDGSTPRVEPWAGITRGFTAQLMDQSENRYLEFWIRPREAKGTITIDLGEVSEDISLNGREPNNMQDYESYSSTISEETDLGIDALRDEYEHWYYPTFTTDSSWVKLEYGDPRLGSFKNDPAKDNWALYDKENIENRRFVNKTQKNIDVNNSPDREDIDGDGIVLPARSKGNFFRFTMDLETLTQSPFYDGSQIANVPDSGWYHVRIPISMIPDSIEMNPHNIYTEIGNPEWHEIRHVRILWYDMASQMGALGAQDSLEFEGIQFVGNQWKEQMQDSLQTGLVVASILDSRTTPGYDYPKMKILDTLNGEQVTDYTLRLEFNNVPKDSTVLVRRLFESSQAINLNNYREIRFWANDTTENINTADDTWFTFRFGSDSSCYYEFKTNRIWENGRNFGWDSEGFRISLDSLSLLKQQWFNVYSERHDFIDTAIETLEGDSLRVFSESQTAPTFSRISWIAFGVVNEQMEDYSGDIRINGFRTVGISDFEGWAVRTSMNLSWSDFMENGANFRYTDAGFRSMSDDVHKESNAQINAGISGKIQLDKFLPDRFGVQVPVGGELTASMQRPEMRPNSDIRLYDENSQSDGLRDMAGDFGRLLTNSAEKGPVTEAEKYQKQGRNRTFYTGFRKNKVSENPVARLTADRIAVDYRMNFRDSISREGEIPESEKDQIEREDFGQYHAEINTSRRHEFNLDYDFSPSSKVTEITSWSPFKNSKKRSIPRRIKTMSFNLLPERVTFDIANVNYNWTEQYNSIQDAIDTTGQYLLNRKPVEEVGIVHGFDLTYKPIAPFLTLTYKINVNRNFDRFIKTWNNSGTAAFASDAVFKMDNEYRAYGVLFSEQRRNQDLKLLFTPEITPWLALSTSGDSRYTQNMELIRDTNYMKTDMATSFDFSTTYRMRRFFEDISKATKKQENLSKVFKGIAKGFEVIDFEDITFSYNSSMGLSNSYLDTTYLDEGLGKDAGRYMLYSFGVFNRSVKDFITGNMDDETAFGGVQNRTYANDQKNSGDSRATSQNFSIRTALKFPDPINISINSLSLGWSRQYSITPEVDRMDTSIVWPNIGVNMSTSALEELEIVKTHFSRFKLDGGYTYRLTNARSGQPSKHVQKNHTISWGFSPLIKVSTTIKKRAIDLTYGVDLGFDTTATYDSLLIPAENRWRDSLTRSTQKRTTIHTLTGSYHINGKKGRTMKLFRDQIVEIKGDMDYTLSVEIRNVMHKFHLENNLTGENEDFDETYITIRPEVVYQFTKNIDLRLFYDLIHNVTGKEQSFNHSGQIAGEITITF